VKSAGGYVLAQDEATSQAFGMPGAAIETHLVDKVLPLDDIAPAVIEWISHLEPVS
jgi:two-component system chemotaxis response regulator CheB